MEPNTETVSYIAHVKLTNSDKVAFSRRDLALCFYPLKVVEKADRVFESLVVDGTRTHEDNPKLIKKLWELIPKKHIYNGTVKKITKRSFNWGLIANRICRDRNLNSFKVEPERQRTATSPVRSITIETKTSDYDEHVKAIEAIHVILRNGNKHLTFDQECSQRSIHACPPKKD